MTIEQFAEQLGISIAVARQLVKEGLTAPDARNEQFTGFAVNAARRSNVVVAAISRIKRQIEKGKADDYRRRCLAADAEAARYLALAHQREMR